MSPLPQNRAALDRRADAQNRLRIVGAGLDVRHLPSFGFGHRSLMWWGTVGLIAIEGTIFAIAVGVYFYLMSRSNHWPPAERLPDPGWATLNTALMIASVLPAYLAKRAAEALDLGATRRWLTMGSIASLVILGVRAFEFPSLNCAWDGSAYGSAVWMIMGLHTLHLVTDAYDTLVLNVLIFTGPLEGKRFSDVSENALYWFFVVASWLPLYAVIHGAPRWT
jgi:cytochrome c oxidase subunit I+III